jgi:hypothetical protein
MAKKKNSNNLNKDTVFIVSAVVVAIIAILLATNLSGQTQSGAVVSEIGAESHIIEITATGNPSLSYPKKSIGGYPGIKTTASLDGEVLGIISNKAPDNTKTASDGSKITWLVTHGTDTIRVFGTTFQFKGTKCSKNLEFEINALSDVGEGIRGRFVLTDIYTGQVFDSRTTARIGERIGFDSLPGYTIKMLPGSIDRTTAKSASGEVQPLSRLKFELTC